MTIDLHHVHILASDITATIAWWCRYMNARVLFDQELAGARNVMLAIGTGRLNIYDQAPKDRARGPIHHIGLRVTNLRHVWKRLQEDDLASPNGLREHEGWRYVMVAAPDNILVELFEFDDPSAPINTDGAIG